MTRPVESVAFCPWEGQTVSVDHDCIADTRVQCEARTTTGSTCGTCAGCLAAQAADPRYARQDNEETP